MSQTVIVRGRYTGRTFILDTPLPDTTGPAELVITPVASPGGGSVADSFGTAAVLRSAADILTRLQSDRDEWGDR